MNNERLQSSTWTRPLTNEELKRLAKKYPPPKEWYEGDDERPVTITSVPMPEGLLKAGQNLMREQYAAQLAREYRKSEARIAGKWRSFKRCLVLLVILLILIAVARVRAADPVADVKNWHRDGLPICANWNTFGFSFDWHVEQVRAGNRLLPTLKLPVLTPDEFKNSAAPTLKPDNAAFLRDNRLPICIRTDNVATVITRLPRLPKTIENLPLSPVVWTLKGGVLDDEAIADVFGPVQSWSDAGAQWAQMKIMRELQIQFPFPAYVVLADNNEANRDKPDRYWEPVVDGTGRAIQTNNGGFQMRWKPLDMIERLSIRTRDFASEHTIDEQRHVSHANHNEKYNALFAAFRDTLTPGWRELLTEGYAVGTFTTTGDIDVSDQYDYQFGHYDGGGSSLYINGDADSQWSARTTLSDFTSPAWFKVYHLTPSAERAESINPKHFREVFLMMSGAATYNGLQRGRHAMMTPDASAGHLQWLLWSIKGDRRPVMLRYWLGNQTGPTTPFFATDAARKIVNDLGFPEIANGTQAMYVNAMMSAVNTILDNPTLRKFWQDGTPVCTGTHPEFEIRWKEGAKPVTYPVDGPNKSWRLLDVDVNTPRSKWINQPTVNSRGGYTRDMQIKVWGTATELDGDFLVHLWTPCKLDGTVRFTIPGAGTFEVPAPAQNSYWLVKKPVGYIVEAVE